MGSVIGYQKAHGPIATFETDVAEKIKNLVVDINPVQSGTGNPSPDNVRPITGWTGMKVTRTGKNLFGGTLLRDGIKASMPSAVINEDEKYISFAANATVVQNITQECGLTNKFKELTPYTVIMTVYKGGEIGTNLAVYYTNGSSTPIPNVSSIGIKETKVLVTDANKTVAYIGKRNAGSVTRLYYEESGIFEGVLTADDFVPYEGTTYPVSWETEAGTVYGGTLDVVKGELVMDRAQIVSYNGETLPGEWISDMDVYAAGAFPTTGAQVIYKLAIPITYQLTPQEINTIIGTNTIYADTGDISVIYPKTITPVKIVSNVNLLELRKNIIAAQGNDNLYNKWVWRQDKNDFIVRNNTVGFLEGLGNNIYADQRSNRENNRRSIVVKRGNVPFVAYDSASGGTHTPVKLYPIPMPPNATSVQMSCDNDAQDLLMGAMMLRLENGVYKRMQLNTYFMDISRPLWLITGNHHFLAPYIQHSDNSNFTNELKNVKFTFSRIGAPRWTLTDEDVTISKMNIKWDSNGPYISFASNDEVNNYLTVVTNRGLCGYRSYDGSTLYNVSPIPIPPTATKVTVTTTPKLQAHLILLKCFDNQTQQLITDNSWKSSPVTMTFDTDDNLELAVALRVNSREAAFTTSKTPTEIIIQFE